MSFVNQEEAGNDSTSTVEVEAIMASIREKMQENRRVALAQGLQPRQFAFADYPEEPAFGDYDRELYAHLRQVNQPHHLLGIQRVLRSSVVARLPLVGIIWRHIQEAGHDLVIFYMKSLAGEIVDFQRHVAGVLNRLVGWRQEKDAEIRRLQEEITALKERLDLLEAKK